VLRQRVAGDRRRALILLTDEGRALYASMFPRVVELHHKVLAGLDGVARQALADVLHRLHVNAWEAFRDTRPAARADRRKATRPPGAPTVSR